MNIPARRTYSIRISILCMLIIAAIGLLTLALLTRKSDSPAMVSIEAFSAEAAVTHHAQSAPVQETYMLRESGGVICVFSSSGKLIMHTEILISSLRAVDRDELRAGVYAGSMEKVLQLLEDYGS